MDTSLFPQSFQTRLLSAISDEHPLDETTDGVLIHADNFQALNLLQARYREQVKCIYIDPPYNTDGDGFIYKDGYQHSSWLTQLHNRIDISKSLLSDIGTLGTSIDDNEVHHLDICLSNIFPQNKIGELSVIRAEGGGLAKRIVKGHDYLLLYAKNIEQCPILLRKKDIRGQIIERNGEKFWIETDWLRVEFGKYGTLFYEDIEKVKGLDKKIEIDNGLEKGMYVLIPKGDKNIVGRYRSVDEDGSKFYSVIKHLNKDGNLELNNLFRNVFSYPKPVSLISQYVLGSTFGENKKNAIILDYFAGSGTTAHAVINLNREDGGKRKYILVEQGEYFDTVLKPRVQKVIFSENWKDGKPQADKEKGYNGVSQIVKVLKLESYEDTLNNLQLKNPPPDLLSMLPESAQEDYLLHYMLDVESKGSLLNTDDFKKPFDYQLNIATDSAGAYEAVTIDLVETFNYLLGLRVERFNDAREKRGYLSVEGKLPSGEYCLVLWRDCEQVGYEKLEELLASLNIEPNTIQYDVVYINGDQNIATIVQEDDGSVKNLKLRPIEPEFLSLMFQEN